MGLCNTNDIFRYLRINLYLIHFLAKIEREKKSNFFSSHSVPLGRTYTAHLLLTTCYRRHITEYSIDKMVSVNDSNTITHQIYQWYPGLQLAACIFYSIILLVGVTGNVLVILIVMRYREMRNATNFLLTNLSVADLFVLIFCTPEGYQHLYGEDKHRLGTFMCMFIRRIKLAIVVINK